LGRLRRISRLPVARLKEGFDRDLKTTPMT
jgi:hypothetical protein